MGKMPSSKPIIEVRQATADEDLILVRHYRALWESYGVPDEHIRPDAEAGVLEFIRESREQRALGVFLAFVDGEVVGSTACHKHISPYPEVVLPEHRQFGYIWHVYADSTLRRQGIGRSLVERALAHLRENGCTTAVLHSSPAGEKLYAELGFQLAKEMRLGLSTDPSA